VKKIVINLFIQLAVANQILPLLKSPKQIKILGCQYQIAILDLNLI